MKKLIILLALIANPVYADRLGPSDVTDYYLEPAISAYITSIANSDDNNKATVSLIGSLWYVKYKVNVGVEVLGSPDTTGVFIAGRYAIDNQWNISAGLGKVGYNVDTGTNDYYAKPTALMLSGDYQTEYGKIIARFIMSESSKNYYLTGNCIHTNALPDNHLDSCTGGSISTSNTRQMIMLGFQVDL